MNDQGGGSAPLINQAALFNALVDWVERDVAPDHVVATQNLAGGAVRSRKICKYPDKAVYNGTGSTDDEGSFRCVVHRKVPADLMQEQCRGDPRWSPRPRAAARWRRFAGLAALS